MHYRSIFRNDLFSGQTYLVTGGGTGIGRAVAHELASLGAHVVLAARTEENLIKTATEIREAGGAASHVVCNIREEEQVAALFERVLAERGALHGLVNNAGGQFVSPAETISLKGWRAVVETNLTGTFLMCRVAFNRHMEAHGGAIVNMLIEMWRGFPGMAHSAAARAGIENLTKTLAVEWARAGVRVNAVAPGLIASSGLDRYPEAVRPMIEQNVRDIPLKRMGTEAEVSAAIVFLLSPAAAFITGESIRIDGGGSLWRKTWEVAEHGNAPAEYSGYLEEKKLVDS
ncbi:SDR family oxidoreductase [Promineifilum sp.]|uniref:SDR family oxidoreductase n=1 Tax=Promineifilum sp. TaxID=2664178 RepID=UPI0035B3236A